MNVDVIAWSVTYILLLHTHDFPVDRVSFYIKGFAVDYACLAFFDSDVYCMCLCYVGRFLSFARCANFLDSLRYV